MLSVEKRKTKCGKPIHTHICTHSRLEKMHEAAQRRTVALTVTEKCNQLVANCIIRLMHSHMHT